MGRDSMPAVEEGQTHESRLAPARAVLALVGPHPSFRWIAPGYGLGLRGVSPRRSLMLKNLYYGSGNAVNPVGRADACLLSRARRPPSHVPYNCSKPARNLCETK